MDKLPLYTIILFYTNVNVIRGSETTTEEPLAPLGCYKNDRGNNSYLLQLPTNTSVSCIEKCGNSGCKFAATFNHHVLEPPSRQEYRTNCFCSMEKPNNTLKVNSTKCSSPCSSNTDLCGGQDRRHVSLFAVPDSNQSQHNDLNHCARGKNATIEYPTTAVQSTSITTKIEENTTSFPQQYTTKTCLCATFNAKWNFSFINTLTLDEIRFHLKDHLLQLQHNISIDVKSTSLYKNKKMSASDKRRSSAVMGWIAGLIIAVLVLCIVGSDLMNCFGMRN